MNNEIWKDIPGLEDLYQASNLGNIRSLNYNKTGKIRNIKKCKDSISEAKRQLGADVTSIGRVCNKKRKKHLGLIWEWL